MRSSVIFLFLIVIIAGCQQGGETKTGSSSTPFIGGTQGLKIGFVDNAPPPEVLDNNQMAFDVSLRLENVGEYTIPPNKIKSSVVGIFPPSFGKTIADLNDKTFPRELRGVQKDPDGEKIDGDIDEMTFAGLTYKGSLQGNNEFPIQADICYLYQSKAVGDFCMRENTAVSSGGVCDVKGIKKIHSSGGPVQVTSLEESVGGRNKVILKFKIKTVDAGAIFKPDPALKCNSGDFSEENFVKVKVNTHVFGLTCSGLSGSDTPEGFVRLSNGEASLTCIQSNVNVDAIQKVDVTLEYNHLISDSTKIIVKHIPNDFSSSSSSSSTSTSTSSGGGTGGNVRMGPCIEDFDGTCPDLKPMNTCNGVSDFSVVHVSSDPNTPVGTCEEPPSNSNCRSATGSRAFKVQEKDKLSIDLDRELYSVRIYFATLGVPTINNIPVGTVKFYTGEDRNTLIQGKTLTPGNCLPSTPVPAQHIETDVPIRRIEVIAAQRTVWIDSLEFSANPLPDDTGNADGGSSSGGGDRQDAPVIP